MENAWLTGMKNLLSKKFSKTSSEPNRLEIRHPHYSDTTVIFTPSLMKSIEITSNGAMSGGRISVTTHGSDTISSQQN